MIWRLLSGREVTRRFAVFEPPMPARDRIDRAEALEFVGDRFSWGAFLLGGLWLVGQRLWLWLGAYVAALVAVELVVLALGLGRPWLIAGVALAHLLLGFEAEALQTHAFEQRGWARVGEVSGRCLDDCERRFFDTWLPAQAMRSAGAATGAETAAHATGGFRATMARLFGG